MTLSESVDSIDQKAAATTCTKSKKIFKFSLPLASPSLLRSVAVLRVYGDFWPHEEACTKNEPRLAVL